MKKGPGKFWKWLDWMVEYSLRPGPYVKSDEDYVRFLFWTAIVTSPLIAMAMLAGYLSR